MSSRNAYLTAAQRAVAPMLFRAITQVAEAIAHGEIVAGAVAGAKARLEGAGFTVDYLEARDAVTLKPVEPGALGPLRVLVAAWLGKTRLIDNTGVQRKLHPGL